MSDIRETTIDHVAGYDHATFYSGERKWINEIYRLKELYPDDVDIRHINDDGSLIANIPASWMKIKPKKKVNLSEEQIAASKVRLESGRLKRLSMMGDDAQVTQGKELDENEKCEDV